VITRGYGWPQYGDMYISKPTGELGSLVFSSFLQQIGCVLSIGFYRRAEYVITISNPVKKYK
jgi:hypothetical protein